MNDKVNYSALPVTTVFENTSQEVIVITNDKLCRILMEHAGDFERRREWHTPLGLVFAIALTLATTVFHDFWGLSAATWQAIFLVSLVLLVAWLIKAAWRAAHAPSVVDLVAKIKRGG